MPVTSLNGQWQAWTDLSVANEFYQSGFDRAPDYELTVPGHWQRHPALKEHAGSVFYRREFDWQPGGKQQVARLEFQGVFYEATVWLNGQRLGRHAGYFQNFGWELSSELRPGRNVLAVRVDCPPPGKTWRDIIIGIYGEWDSKPEKVHPGGIWGDVSLVRHHLGYLEEVNVESRLSSFNTAHVHFSANYVWRGTSSQVHARLEFKPRNFTGKTFEQTTLVEVAPGNNQLNLRLNLPDPKLWWPWDQGKPNLYNISVELRDATGQEVGSYHKYHAVRTIEWKKWQLHLNGRRMFLRGANYGPTSFYPAEVTEEQIEDDLDLVRGANLNSLRVYNHVAPPTFYEQCAERGIILWQDFPLDKRYDHHITGPALKQIREMIFLLRNEPAICFWSCHNEPYARPISSFKRQAGGAQRGTATRSARLTWNKDVLDPRLKAAAQLEDATRPVFAHSGVFGFLRGGSDTHNYWGWNTIDYRTFLVLSRFFKHILRLVTEFGAQSWPADPQFLARVEETGEWPNLDWSQITAEFQLVKQHMDAHVNPEEFASLTEYALATQAYQAELLQFYAEALRVRKYRPCGGAFMFSFADAWPIISWSILDHKRQAKLGYETIKRVMYPVLIATDWPRPEYLPGDRWHSKVYVVNDYHRPLVAMGLTWELISPSGAIIARERRIADAEPDSVTEVGEIAFQLPDSLVGEYKLKLSLDIPHQRRIENSYRLLVVE